MRLASLPEFETLHALTRFVCTRMTSPLDYAVVRSHGAYCRVTVRLEDGAAIDGLLRVAPEGSAQFRALENLILERAVEEWSRRSAACAF